MHVICEHVADVFVATRLGLKSSSVL